MGGSISSLVGHYFTPRSWLYLVPESIHTLIDSDAPTTLYVSGDGWQMMATDQVKELYGMPHCMDLRRTRPERQFTRTKPEETL